MYISKNWTLHVAISNVSISLVAHLNRSSEVFTLSSHCLRSSMLLREYIQTLRPRRRNIRSTRHRYLPYDKKFLVALTEPPSQIANCFRDSLCGAPRIPIESRRTLSIKRWKCRWENLRERSPSTLRKHLLTGMGLIRVLFHRALFPHMSVNVETFRSRLSLIRSAKLEHDISRNCPRVYGRALDSSRRYIYKFFPCSGTFFNGYRETTSKSNYVLNRAG